MIDQEIVHRLRELFDGCETPGRAFDVLLELRKAHVQFADVANALRANIRRAELDHAEDNFECPNCGISRTTREQCVNPTCPDYKNLSVSTPGFKNPVINFGRKHAGKTLLEVGEVDVGYLKWMADKHGVPFWKEQARLALADMSSSQPDAYVEDDPSPDYR